VQSRIFRFAAIIAACLLTAAAAQAATWGIWFCQRVSPPTNNLYDDHISVGGGTFEIADDAVTPGNIVLFEEDDFLSFDIVIVTDEDAPRQFTLGIDQFPYSTNTPFPQGILFDDSAEPLRFDTPITVTGNGAKICDGVCSNVGNTAELRLIDNDDFNLGYVISDGTIDDYDTLLLSHPPEEIKRLGGVYTYQVGVNIGGSGIQKQGYYEIIASAPPPCLGDFEPDGDVDGSDLTIQAGGGTGISTGAFAHHFGRDDCPS
jgi:hypothetical protein